MEVCNVTETKIRQLFPGFLCSVLTSVTQRIQKTAILGFKFCVIFYWPRREKNKANRPTMRPQRFALCDGGQGAVTEAIFGKSLFALRFLVISYVLNTLVNRVFLHLCRNFCPKIFEVDMFDRWKSQKSRFLTKKATGFNLFLSVPIYFFAKVLMVFIIKLNFYL